LERRGVPIVPTRVLPGGEPASFAALARATGWRDLVLKPAISCGSRLTFRVAADDVARGDEVLQTLAAEGDALAQPYLTSVYARVDMAPGPDGTPVLMELELIEPTLFFPACPAALERFARAVKRHVDAKSCRL
jgi:hypothetical protein